MLREKLSIVALIATLYVIVVMFSYALDASSITIIVRDYGLPSLWVIFFITIHALIISIKIPPATVWKKKAPLLGIWLLCAIFSITSFPKGYRTLMDEVVLAGTSRAIHEERQIINPTYLEYTENVHKLSGGYVDKRPYLFATLVSFFHDLFGYSSTNLFYTNMLLGCGALGLVFYVGAKVSGWWWGGLIALLALASLPVFCQQVSGGGIDILNLFMLLALFICCHHYTENPSTDSLHLMLGVSALLGYSRYESLVYWLFTALCLLFVYITRKRFYFDWRTPILAFALVPLFGIHYLTFSRLDVAVQTETVKAGAAFSLAYVFDNLIHSLNFFLNTEHMATNSPFIFIVGMCAFLLLVVSGLRLYKNFYNTSVNVCFWFFSLCSILSFFLLMSYCWGALDTTICNRLSLPVYLYFIICIAKAVGGRRFLALFLCVMLLFSAYWSIPPIAAKNYAASQYSIYRELALYKGLVCEQPDKSYMVIHDLSNFWLTEDVYCVHPKAINSNPSFLISMLESAHFRRVYLVQRLNYDKKSQRYMIVLDHKVDLPLSLKMLSEDSVNDQYRIRISLVDRESLEKLRSNVLVTESPSSITSLKVIR